MLRAIKDRLTYANVMATFAVFIALGGSSYAAFRVGSPEIRNNSVRSVDLRNDDVRGRDVDNGTLTGRDVKRNGLGGGAVKESALGKVPSAATADTVGGATAEQLKTKCPVDTAASSGVCVENVASAPADRAGAGYGCRRRGRQLAGYETLLEYFFGADGPAAGGEWTADTFESRSTPGQLDTVVITSGTGAAAFQKVFTPAARSYRCVAIPGN